MPLVSISAALKMDGSGEFFSSSVSGSRVASAIKSLLSLCPESRGGVRYRIRIGCQHACTARISSNSSQSGRVRNHSTISRCNCGLSSTSARNAACCLRFLVPHFSEKCGRKYSPWDGRIRQIPRDCIQFTVSHHGKRGTGLNHAPGDHDRVNLTWSEVYKIAEKNDLALRVTPCAVSLFVAHLDQERCQCFCVAVNIPDDVVCIRHVTLVLLFSIPLPVACSDDDGPGGLTLIPWVSCPSRPGTASCVHHRSACQSA